MRDAGEESALEREKGAERENEIKKETGNSYANVYRCASVCVALKEDGRAVKPRLRIYDIELEVRRAGSEVGANKI